MFSYLSPEKRVPAGHPLGPIRTLVERVLLGLHQRFETIYATIGRPSIPPEKWLRALLLQILYSVRSERMLMEQLSYNLLFRWFVGMNLDEDVWVPPGSPCRCKGARAENFRKRPGTLTDGVFLALYMTPRFLAERQIRGSWLRARAGPSHNYHVPLLYQRRTRRARSVFQRLALPTPASISNGICSG